MATVVKKSKKNTRIIKVNKKKVIVWSSVGVIFVTGISLTLYFTLRGDKALWPPEMTKVTVEEAIDITLSDERKNEITGIYIGSNDTEEGCPHCHEAIYGTPDLTDSDELNGEFSKYLESAKYIEWFGVEGESISSATEDFETYLQGVYGENVYVTNSNILLFPSTDSEIDDMSYYTNRENLLENYAIALSPNKAEILGETTGSSTEEVNEDGETVEVDAGSSLGIPLFMWVYNNQLIGISSGFTPGNTDEDGNIIDNEQTYQYWLAIEDILASVYPEI